MPGGSALTGSKELRQHRSRAARDTRRAARDPQEVRCVGGEVVVAEILQEREPNMTTEAARSVRNLRLMAGRDAVGRQAAISARVHGAGPRTSGRTLIPA
jgi:hypothetical protein